LIADVAQVTFPAGKDPKEQSMLRSKTGITALAAISLAGFMGNASANVLFTYTGNPFTIQQGNVYTVGESLVITLDLQTALPDNQTTQIFSAPPPAVPLPPGSFSFQVVGGQGCGVCNGVANFSLTTNATGQITSWDVSYQEDIQSFLSVNSSQGNEDSAALDGQSASESDDPGSWTASIMPVSEPSSLALGAFALAVLGWLRPRRAA
jgi:hypothetical protein